MALLRLRPHHCSLCLDYDDDDQKMIMTMTTTIMMHHNDHDDTTTDHHLVESSGLNEYATSGELTDESVQCKVLRANLCAVAKQRHLTESYANPFDIWRESTPQ